MRFTKLHGLGNDFLVVPPGGGQDPAAAGDLARRICDRHTGVGADGLILLGVEKSEPAEVGFRVFNADGSEAEISGNGLRCAAAFLAWCGAVKSPKVLFRSAAGEHPSEILSAKGPLFEAKIGLGVPRLAAKDIPFDDGQNLDRVQDYPLFVIKRTFPVTCLSMGNPHCSLFFDAFPTRSEWRGIGAEIETHPFFPNQDERRVHPRPQPARDRGPLLGARGRRNAGFGDGLSGGRCLVHAQGPDGQGRHREDGHRQLEGRMAGGRPGPPDGTGRGRLFGRLSGRVSGVRRSLSSPLFREVLETPGPQGFFPAVRPDEGDAPSGRDEADPGQRVS